MKMADVVGILIQSGLLGAFLGLLISALKRGKVYLDAKTAESTANIKDVRVARAINTAENSISSVVLEM